jgi:hypothetical protein
MKISKIAHATNSRIASAMNFNICIVSLLEDRYASAKTELL